MTSNNTFKIASYFTNVDLAQGLTTNLAEIELALKLNPNTFAGLMLLDQANGDAGSSIKYNNGYPHLTAAFPTGWGGSNNYTSGGFSQNIWTETGIGLIKASKLDKAITKKLYKESQKVEAKSKYADALQYILNKTGSSYNQYDPTLSALGREKDIATQISFLSDINLGISSEFFNVGELQTGSPLAVDFLLNQSNTSTYFGENPHAIFLSNHGGSYLLGGNGDGPKHDGDETEANLQVKDLASSLNNAITTYSADNTRLGLVAFDECQMANIETLTQLSQSTRYLLASQRDIPGNGYDYFLTLSDFRTTAPLSNQAGIEANAKVLGKAFVDTYSARNGSEETLSLTDSDAVKELNAAIKAYADALIASDDAYIISLLKAIRLKGTNYGYEWSQDLGNVAAISKSSRNAPKAIIQASENILTSLNKAVVANNHSYRPLNGYQQGLSSGLTITLPTALAQWRQEYQYINSPSDVFKFRAPEFEATTGWSRVLDKITPLLKTVETNSGHEELNLRTENAEASREDGSEAYLALKIDGYLTQTSYDSAINATRLELPELDNAFIGELELNFNVLNLHQSGTATFSLRDSNNKEKASWKKTIDDAAVFALIGADLEASIKALKVEKGDSLVITPDETIAARYDLDLVAQNQKLNSFSDEWDEKNKQKPIGQPSLFNFSLDADENQLIYYSTPVSPSNTPFQTDIVLLSSNEGINTLTIENLNTKKSVTFSSSSFIEESIQLDANSAYEFEVEFSEDATTSSLSSDLALLINHQGRPTAPVTDAVLSKNTTFDSWGTVDINSSLNGDLTIVKMNTDLQIDGLHSLNEGKSVDAKIEAQTINKNSTIEEKYSGGNETVFSGLWSTNDNLTLICDIEGTSSNPAQLGFFEVDTLTGGIQTNAGLIAPSQNDSYKSAALDNLISPLANLNSRNKSGTIEIDLEAGKSFGAVLLTKGENGVETALYSIAGANPDQSVQFLNFGGDYYGIEDLVQGRDSGYDGDFNDITFYMS